MRKLLIVLATLTSLTQSLPARASEYSNVHRIIYEKCKHEFDQVQAKEKADYYTPVIIRVAHKQHLPAEIVASLIWYESNYYPRMVSSAGALGLMQVMPEHFRHGEHWYNPTDNMNVGCSVLHRYFMRFGDWHKALTAYCYGPRPVSRGMYRSRYSIRVLATAW